MPWPLAIGLGLKGLAELGGAAWGLSWLTQQSQQRRPKGQMERMLGGTRTAQLAQERMGMTPWQLTQAGQLPQYTAGLREEGLGKTRAAEAARGGDRDGDRVGQDIRVVSEGGYDFLVYYNRNGDEVGREMLGRTSGAAAGAPQWRPGELEAEEEWRRMQQERWEQEAEMEQQRFEYQRQIQEQQMQWEQERFAAEEERTQQNYLASLRANPMSWLEYASAAGEEAAIQPWMLPLMQGQYQAGQAIPGFGGEEMTDMPELMRPSRQLQARMGPTAMAQYGGYQQAQTGQPPGELDWRMWSAAPPGGRFGGLSRRR